MRPARERRVWDSNPRDIAAHWFSRPGPSAARTTLPTEPCSIHRRRRVYPSGADASARPRESDFSVGLRSGRRASPEKRRGGGVTVPEEPRPSRRPWLLDLRTLTQSPAYARFWASGLASGVGTQLQIGRTHD